MNSSRSLTLAVLALAFALAGCGGSKTADIPSGNGGGSTAASTPTTTAPSGGPEDKLGQKPAVAKGSGPPPTGLKVIDLVKGKGAVAAKGKKLTMQYVGVLFDSGAQFDASWDNGQPFQFTLGRDSVIPGWTKGVPGMRVGGRRKLIIPAELGYGAQGSPPSIPPNSALIFDIDLLKVG
jgi:FKBP-type peptidyl-prolyl cis-trans isomerase